MGKDLPDLPGTARCFFGFILLLFSLKCKTA